MGLGTSWVIGNNGQIEADAAVGYSDADSAVLRPVGDQSQAR